jgi:hypothetical protein
VDINVNDYDFLTLGSRQEMSMIKLITTVSLVVALIAVIASNQSSIYAYATTEDDGWVEGDDDSQGEISSQEELEDAYEGSQWEDDIGSNEFEEATDNDDENDDELVECEDASLVESEESCERSEALVTCSDGSSAATQAECPPTPAPTTTQTCPDGSVVSVNEVCPPMDIPLKTCDGSIQDCITPYEDFCPAESVAHECELQLPEVMVQCSDGSTPESQELCPTEQLVQSKTCPNGVAIAMIQDYPLPVKELTQEEQQEWNKSCGDAGEQAGESGQAFSKETAEMKQLR